MNPLAQKGAISIIALWILAILAILATGFAYRMSLELKLSGYQLERLKATYLARAGINRAIYELERDTTLNCDALNEPWSNNPEAFREVLVGDGTYTVSYPWTESKKKDRYGLIDEERRININQASPHRELKRLFSLIAEGISSPIDADELAACVKDWRDPDSTESEPNGAEETYYQSLENPYHCKNGSFQTIEELLLVKGVTPEIFSNLQDLITVYGDGKVNINTAPGEVLEALGLKEELRDKILWFRRGEDGLLGTEDDGFFETANYSQIKTTLNNFEELSQEELSQVRYLNYLISRGRISVSSSYYRINSVGVSPGGKVTKAITAVVQRTGNGLPRIAFWHED